jgi:hypothetical protein
VKPAITVRTVNQVKKVIKEQFPTVNHHQQEFEVNQVSQVKSVNLEDRVK